MIILGFVMFYRPDNWIDDKMPPHKIDQILKNCRRGGIVCIALGLFLLIGGIYEIVRKQ